MSYMSQNFCLFYVSNLSVINFRTSLRMYPGSLAPAGVASDSSQGGSLPDTGHTDLDGESRANAVRKSVSHVPSGKRFSSQFSLQLAGQAISSLLTRLG